MGFGYSTAGPHIITDVLWIVPDSVREVLVDAGGLIVTEIPVILIVYTLLHLLPLNISPIPFSNCFYTGTNTTSPTEFPYYNPSYIAIWTSNVLRVVDGSVV